MSRRNKIGQLPSFTFSKEQVPILQSALNLCSFPISYQDTSGRFLIINQAFGCIYEGKQVIGNTIETLCSVKTAKYHTAKDLEALRKKTPVTYIASNDDDVLRGHTITKIPHLNCRGLPQGIITIGSNRKEWNTDEIQEEPSPLNEFSKLSGTMLVLSHDTILEATEGAKNLFRCSGEIIVGSSIFDFMPEAQRNGAKSRTTFEDILCAAYEKKSNAFQWIFKNNDQNLLTCHVNIDQVALTFNKILFVHIVVD